LELEAEGDVVRFVTQGTEGFRVSVESFLEPIWVLRDAPRIMPAPSEAAVLKSSAMLTDDGFLDACSGSWLQHPLLSGATTASNEANVKNATDSWRGAFKYILEDKAADVVGLRPPQAGALHAIHAHWSISYEVASIVLPTAPERPRPCWGF
jgi:hypothetical protein